MSYDLGFSRFINKNTSVETSVQEFIAFLEREFDYVMIMDRFDESMMLLKIYLEWSNSDMVYLKRMIRSKNKRNPVSPYTVKLISEYNFIDEKVYQHFSKIFEKRRNKIGKERIDGSVAKYRLLNVRLTETCLNTSAIRETKLGTFYYSLKQTAWSIPQCRLLSMSDIFISKALAMKQSVRGEKPHKFDRWYNLLPNVVNLFSKIRQEYLEGESDCKNCTHVV